MNIASLKAGAFGISSAIIASLCCVLPLTVLVLGLGSGAFMMVTMQYRAIFLPIGVIGVGLGYYLYFRERSRCNSIGCAFVGRKINLALLVFATVVVGVAIILDIFPELTAEIFQGVM